MLYFLTKLRRTTMKKLTFRPGQDILAIKHLPEARTTASGIITETVRTNKYPARGEVIAVGPSMMIEVEIGDIVLYNMAVEDDIQSDGYTFDLALSQNVLGTFPKKED